MADTTDLLRIGGIFIFYVATVATDRRQYAPDKRGSDIINYHNR